eukprot:2580164-Prymnesium_polylepis.1
MRGAPKGANGDDEPEAAAGDKRRVLLASDDNSFAIGVAAALEARLGVSVHRLQNDFEITSRQEAASVCNASCIPPLVTMMQSFARARRLMLNTRSNVGSSLLTYWPAANGDRMPTMFDMDEAITSSDLEPDRYFCSLPHGSRKGLCSNGLSREALTQMELSLPCQPTWPKGPAAKQMK